jgi:hypothetical protein
MSFGCMTAAHKCPHCRKAFDYDPNDYHRKITCGGDKCKREFGFMQVRVAGRCTLGGAVGCRGATG